MALPDEANSSSATPSKNHKANLHEKDPTLLISLVSPIFILNETLSPRKTSGPAHKAGGGCFITAVLGRDELSPRTHLAMSGDMFGCHSWKRGATSI